MTKVRSPDKRVCSFLSNCWRALKIKYKKCERRERNDIPTETRSLLKAIDKPEKKHFDCASRAIPVQINTDITFDQKTSIRSMSSERVDKAKNLRKEKQLTQYPLENY